MTATTATLSPALKVELLKEAEFKLDLALEAHRAGLDSLRDQYHAQATARLEMAGVGRAGRFLRGLTA